MTDDVEFTGATPAEANARKKLWQGLEKVISGLKPSDITLMPTAMVSGNHSLPPFESDKPPILNHGHVSIFIGKPDISEDLHRKIALAIDESTASERKFTASKTGRTKSTAGDDNVHTPYISFSGPIEALAAMDEHKFRNALLQKGQEPALLI